MTATSGINADALFYFKDHKVTSKSCLRRAMNGAMTGRRTWEQPSGRIWYEEDQEYQITYHADQVLSNFFSDQSSLSNSS